MAQARQLRGRLIASLCCPGTNHTATPLCFKICIICMCWVEQICSLPQGRLFCNSTLSNIHSANSPLCVLLLLKSLCFLWVNSLVTTLAHSLCFWQQCQSVCSPKPKLLPASLSASISFRNPVILQLSLFCSGLSAQCIVFSHLLMNKEWSAEPITTGERFP